MTNESKRNIPLRRSSRVVKFAMLIVFILALLWLISAIMIFVLTIIAEYRQVSDSTLTLIMTVAESLKIDVAGAIGAVSTAVVARYGVREFSANWKGIKYDSETESEEDKQLESSDATL